MGTYYHTCPLCGAHLDPGEKCDCIIGIDLSESEDFSILEPEFLRKNFNIQEEEKNG